MSSIEAMAQVIQLSVAPVFLLREVGLSTRHMREGMELALEDAGGDLGSPR